MRCLTITCEGMLCAIGIVDELNDITYCYNSGINGEYTAVQGNLYPHCMATDDSETVLAIIKNFLQNGKPSKKVKWIKE